MPEPTPSDPKPLGAPTSLQEVADALRSTHHLEPEDRERLAALITELESALNQGALPPEEQARLRADAHALAVALHRKHEPPAPRAARERLREGIVGLEVRAPVVAGVARRFLDMLADLGI
jgi:hypothetical protein